MADPIPINAARARRSVKLHRLDALPERPQRDEVIENLFAVGEIVALVGKAGEGKSAIAQLAGTCIAEGRPFLGRRVKTPGPVIFITAERANGTQRRLLAIRRKAKAPIYVGNARPNLANLDDIDDLANVILRVCDDERSCPALIIFDTLARCMPGLDENSARDMGLVVEGLTRLAERVPSAAIMFVHHTGKGVGSEMRGSSALIGGVDLNFAWTGGATQDA